jgi:aldehyde dehydrogenase (NAD+)
MYVRDQLYIGGQWITPSGHDTLVVPNSTTEQQIGSVVMGGAADAAAATQAAADAWPAWAALTAAERSGYLHEVSNQMFKRMDELVDLFSQEVGTPTAQAKPFQQLAASLFASYAERAEAFEWTISRGNSRIAYEPIGVVGAITPWNFPLLLMSVKTAPALAAGCTVAVKPAEIAPLTAFVLAEAMDAAGLPPGVFNMITGTGAEVGEALVGSPNVDMISFVGSTRAGRRISAVASETIKRTALELGGKSALVALDDGDLEAAVLAGMDSVSTNNGQGCACLTRIVVPRSRLAEAAEIATAHVQRATIGDPRDESVTIGPMASAQHRDRVQGYIGIGVEEGARLVVGGTGRPEETETGFFVKPSVFICEDPTMRIAQEEIFGPVQVIIPHDGDTDAIRIANSTVYGLAGAVYGADLDRAEKVARAMRTGKVDVNAITFDVEAPFGGYRQSGNGRMYGEEGFMEYLETKSLAGIK